MIKSSTTPSSSSLKSGSTWVNQLEKLLETSLQDLSKSMILKEIFHGVLSPELHFTRNHTIDIPENYTIRIGGTLKLYQILSSSELFYSLPSYYKKSILDILWILLHRSLYDVVRFRCCEDQNGIINILLKLLHVDGDQQDVLINKRIIRLIGIVSVSGISPQDLRAYLQLLKKPSLYSISLLQSLKMMNKIEEGIVKASPFSFFNFGGHDKGLIIDPCPFPFQKEYQILFWFRLECLSESESHDSCQHLISLLNGNNGLDVYVENNILCISVTNSSSESTTKICTEYPLTAGVWYHLCLTHTKPRMSLFAKHELAIYLDQQLVSQEVMRFPSSTSIGIMSNASIGKNFDGQIGPIYLLNEPLPQLAVQLIARQDAGKSSDDIPTGYPLDLLPNLITSDKKTVQFSSKIYSVYHPLRSNGEILIDIHNNHHCQIGPLTRCWNATSVRETLVSLGGIICFLPLLPKLLIENEEIRDDILQKSTTQLQLSRSRSNSIQKSYLTRNNGVISSGVGLGTSLLHTITDPEIESIFSNRTLSYIEATIDELQEDKPIGLIFSIISQSIKGHMVNQASFLFGGGVEMIQYVLTGMPRGAYILKQEEETCILGLLQLRSACHDLPELDAVLTKRLLCNFHIWSNGSYKLQSSLFSVILANIKAQPDVFLSTVGIQLFLDAITLYYLNEPDPVVPDSGPNSLPVSVPVPATTATTTTTTAPPASAPPALLISASSSSISSISSSFSFSFSPTPPTPLPPPTPYSSSANTEENLLRDPNMDPGIPLPSPSRVQFQIDHPSPMPRPAGINSAPRSFRKSVNRRMSQIDPDIDMNAILSQNESTVSVPPPSPKANSKPDEDLRNTFKKDSSRSLSCKFDSSQTFHNDDTDDESHNEDGVVQESYDLVTNSFNGDSRTSLTQEQRKSLRQSLQAVVMILLLQSLNISEIKPFVYFLCRCDDEVVLEESLQMLLCMIIKDNSRKLVTGLTEIFKGTEEFASFLLCRFVQHSYEPLRCVGLTLLVHYYLRIESLPPAIINAYPKKKKNSKLLRAREKYSSMIEGQGLDRFQACGGFALLSLFLDENKHKSSELTYFSLLDMILTTIDSEKQISQTYRSFYYDYCATAGTRNEKKSNIGYVMIDENTEVKNIACLPAFFQALPNLPSVVQERVYCDLLSLLKHNSKNRDLFCQDLNWHTCLYDLVGQLMAVTEGCTTQLFQANIVSDLQSWARFYNPGQEDTITALFSRNHGVLDPVTKSRLGLFPRQLMFDMPRSMSPIQSHQQRNSPIPHTSQGNQSLSTLDTWFDIGMKIYATLLLHALDYKNGYKEVEKTLSQSFDSSHGVAVSLAVFSHLLNEITFSIQSKFKDAVKQSKTEETLSATYKLDNMLSVLVMISIHFVEDDSIVGLGIPDFIFAKRRLELIDETKKELAEAQCTYQCNDSHHQAVCVLANDLCRCGHSKSLHSLAGSSSSSFSSSPSHSSSPKSIGQIVEEKLSQERESGVLISRARSGDDVSSKENVIYTTLTKSENTTHAWIDVRSEIRPQNHETSRPLSRSLSKKKFQLEEVLHPLERGYEVPRGRMVVILQALRYVDTFFFWPSSYRLRNESFLNFISNLSSNIVENQKKGKKILPLSLYNSLLRMSLYVAHGLSPFTQLAVLNIKRIHILMKNIEKTQPESCPRNEWIMVVITHIIATLQRIHQSFYRLYDILGLSYQTEVIPDGPLSHQQKQAEMTQFHQIEESDQAFYKFIEEMDVVQTINNIFYSPAGKQLIEYICACVDVLVTLYNTQRDLIATVMGDRGFMIYTLIIEKHEKLVAKFPNLKDMARSRSSSKDVRERINSGATRRDSIPKNESSNDSEGSTSPVEHRRHSLSTDGERLRTFSSQVDDVESFKLYEGAICALKWLRDPLIRTNLMTNENMIRYALAIEQYEKFHVKAFYEDMVTSKDQFFEKNLRVKYADEMNELTELGEEMMTTLSEQENRRETHDKMMNEVFNKASAMYWNNCLRDFDAEWSPWTSPLKDKSQYIISLHRDKICRRMIMKRGSEVYDHSNASYWGGRGREQSEYDQLVQTNTTSTTTTTAAGTSSSTPPSSSSSSVDVLGADSPSSSSFLKNTLEMTRPKLSRLKSENDWDEKDESDDDGDIEETSVPILSRPEKGLVRFPFQQIEKKKPLWVSTFVWHPDEREIYTVDVTQIMTEQALSGTLLLTNRSLYFHPKKRIGGFATNPDEFHNKRWKLEKLIECYGRRYLLQNCGIELFFEDSSEFFIAFNSTHDLHKFFRFLRKQNVPNLTTGSSLSPAQIYQLSPWTDLWKKRLISNFEYLMRLNIIAGRSYNDITQYPILPWIIKDYQSDTIDLTNSEIFRDLSKPIGALNEHRLREILDRYKSFGDYDMPSFMYGSHYSSAGVILHFMIRQEPFTSMAITLQAGRFDCPDRLFFNLKETWKCCNNSLSDVKELLPDLFYMPELFINTNNLPLGELQDDRGVVNHVLLPKWCKDAFDFIRIHRDALESDYVSDHLHEWIDLIFGYKQTGQAAIDACNVFHYLTYENAIDIDSIQDPLTRNATKAQVTHFGQTPSQILTKEHPKRLSKEECQNPLTSHFNNLKKIRCYTSIKQFYNPNEHGSIVTIQGTYEKLVVFYSDSSIAIYKWSNSPDSDGSPFTLKPEKTKIFPYTSHTIFPYTNTNDLNDQRIRSISVDSSLSSQSYFSMFTLTKKSSKNYDETKSIQLESGGEDNNNEKEKEKEKEKSPQLLTSRQSQSLLRLVQGKKIHKRNIVFRLSDNSNYDRLISCGYWDSHLKAHSLDTFREIATSTGGHIGGINCVCMGDDKYLIVTGGDDCTCRVWVLENLTLVTSLRVDKEIHYNIMNDPTDPISTINNNGDNNFGNSSNLKCVHILWGHNSAVTAITYSNYHNIILSGGENGLLCVHIARTGEYIRSIYTMTSAEDQPMTDLREYCQGDGYPIDQVEISNSGYLYAYCSKNLNLCVFWINGQFLHKITLQTRIECLLLNSYGSMLFCGGSDGRVVVRQAWDLQEVITPIDLQSHGAITSMILQGDEYFLIIGTEDGLLHVATDPDSRWKPMTNSLLKNPLFSTGI